MIIGFPENLILKINFKIMKHLSKETPLYFIFIFIESETPCFFLSYHVIDMKFQPSTTDGKFLLENLRSTQDTSCLHNKFFCIHMSQGLNPQLIA